MGSGGLYLARASCNLLSVFISHLTSHLHCARMILSAVFGLVLLVNVSLSASAPDDSEVHFERFEQEHSLAQGLEPRDGRQGGPLLGCLMGCPRELRPVRGEQRNEEQIFANKCTFDIARCRANRQRAPPLTLSANQNNIVYPSINNGK